MKRIFEWLEENLPRFKSLDLPDASGESESARPDEIDLGIDLPKEIQEMVNEVPTPKSKLPKEFEEPASRVAMPDINSDEHAPTEPILKLLDESSPDSDDTTGFNPYDTATMHKK